MDHLTFPYKRLFPTLVILIALTSSCARMSEQPSDEQDITPAAPLTRTAVIATQASDYSSGAHSIINYSAPRSATNDLLPTGSDVRIFSHGKHFYRIERFGANTITKFSIDDPATPIWQFSTDEPGDTNSNPYAIIFLNETKAYLLRYNSTKAWIVNPSVTQENEAGFKIGELDLSSFADADGSPDMASGVIVGNKLFIALQRYDMVAGPVNSSFIVVFDTNTDTKITDIELDIRNPAGKIKFHDGYIYVPGADDMWGFVPTATHGGIQRINTTTYAVDPVIIAPNNNITNVEISSSTKGYFVVYSGWGNNSLKAFDIQTKSVIAGNIADIGDSGDRSINDIISDKEGALWVADASLTGSGIYIIDPTTDTIQEGPISTNLNPVEITFCEQ